MTKSFWKCGLIRFVRKVVEPLISHLYFPLNKEQIFEITIPGSYYKEIKFMKIQSQENEINKKRGNFKVILETPGLEKQSPRLFSLGLLLEKFNDHKVVVKNGTIIKNVRQQLPLSSGSIEISGYPELNNLFA
ncbi:hypothetical protein RCL_jg6708.t1 [Rhizophagus clarus]|uniref:Uncharacterized protein n=1 Tax=Rhizophagus clarus TaxID=94130 RepID=A0A8H3LGT4_9GLOM|nr:hypothetical protein RCL_jg6708.t1 [Rhizophagus clarus]